MNRIPPRGNGLKMQALSSRIFFSGLRREEHQTENKMAFGRVSMWARMLHGLGKPESLLDGAETSRATPVCTK